MKNKNKNNTGKQEGYGGENRYWRRVKQKWGGVVKALFYFRSKIRPPEKTKGDWEKFEKTRQVSKLTI